MPHDAPLDEVSYLTPQERAYLEREFIRRAIQLSAREAGVKINDDDQLTLMSQLFCQAIGFESSGPSLDN